MLLEIPSLADACVQADWAEASCLFGRDPVISRTEFETALTESNYEESDLIIDDIWAEIDWRKSILANYYPISIYPNRIERIKNWQHSLPYSFMLLLATNFFYGSTKITERNRKIPSKLFERVVTIVSKKYLDRSVNIGSPREGRMPRSLKQSLDFYCSLSNEIMREKPEITHYAKDEGVDVISWNPIDQRSGQVTLLVQCTIERDWTRSSDKINLDTWENIVNFATRPNKALAFPFVCHSQWKNWSTRGGILFDRLRIASIFSMIPTIYLKDRMINWCNGQIDNLKWFE